MDYTLERFNLDMRKVNLFAETAYSEYAFTVEETFMDESVNDYEVEAVITEAADGLLSKIKAAFAKIIESIKKFFANLIEKVKNFFAGNKEEKLKKMVSDNPTLAKEKVEVPNVKEIEEVCGKRAILRKKMMDEYRKGTLTRDKFEQMKEQSDKLGKRLKTVGVVTLAIGAVVGSAFGATKLIQKLKKSELSTVGNAEEISKAEQKGKPSQSQQTVIASGVEVASQVASATTEDEKSALEAELKSVTACKEKAKTVLAHMKDEEWKYYKQSSAYPINFDNFYKNLPRIISDTERTRLSDEYVKHQKRKYIQDKAAEKFPKVQKHILDKENEIVGYDKRIRNINNKINKLST